MSKQYSHKCKTHQIMRLIYHDDDEYLLKAANMFKLKKVLLFNTYTHTYMHARKQTFKSLRLMKNPVMQSSNECNFLRHVYAITIRQKIIVLFCRILDFPINFKLTFVITCLVHLVGISHTLKAQNLS